MARYGVFCFSGTGNSLYAANKIGALLPDAALFPMKQLCSLPPEQNQFDAIVLVFPVHFLAIPKLVKEYIQKAELGPALHVHAIVTHGGDPGNTLYNLDSLLKKKGSFLTSGIDVPMGDSSVVLRTPGNVLEQRVRAVDPVLKRFSGDIAIPLQKSEALRFRMGSFALGKVYDFSFAWYFHSRKGRADPERCTGCGVCVKLCPTANIAIKNGKAIWEKKCADCFGCINLCPQNAVHLGRIHPKTAGHQYRGPRLTAKDVSI